MPRDTDQANRARAFGLRVVECAGWQTRGSTEFNGRGSVNHHTADGPNGSAPSLDGVINGFSGSAPGPLANALQSREPDGNDIFYIVAAGRANHAGEGGWKGLSGNSSVYGLEIEHTGTDPLPEHRQRLAARWHAAMAQGRYGAPMVCQHREWAPNRKIDAAEQVDPNRFRQWVADALDQPGPGPGPIEEPEMWVMNGELPPKPHDDPNTYIEFAIPVDSKDVKVRIYSPVEDDQGPSIWGAQYFHQNAQGLWDNGRQWEMWLPGKYVIQSDVSPQAVAIRLENQGAENNRAGSPVMVTVSGK
jgi:hypothetical protein